MLNVRAASVSQKGFTLIEMSIVLVIIGLIIGGILKGQEIIDASRQKNLITQIDGLRSAVNTFNDKYAGLPGDYSLADTRIAATLGHGNGNGVVGTAAATPAAIAADIAVGATAAAAAAVGSAENQLFFCHLAAAGLIGNSSTNCVATAATFGAGSPLPITGYPSVGMDVVYGTYGGQAPLDAVTTLWLRVHRAPGVALVAGTSDAFSGKTLSQIDGKYDDGQSAYGTIRSAYADANGACAIGVPGNYAFLDERVGCAIDVALVQ